MTHPMTHSRFTAPHRKIEIELKLSADTWRDVQAAFNILERDVAVSGELSTSSVSGGYSMGWILTSKVDENMTHEIWEAALNVYLDDLKKTEAIPLTADTMKEELK